MEQKQMALLFVIGALIGALALFGASSITGYAMWRLGPAADIEAAGIPGQVLENHILAVKDNPALGMQVKEHLAVRDVIRGMQAEGLIEANDEIFMHQGRMLDVNGNARSMSVLFVAVIRDGVIRSVESNVLKDRCLAQDVLKDKMLLALDSDNAILAESAVIRAAQQLTAVEAFNAYVLKSNEVFSSVGITGVLPFGTGGGSNEQMN